jgi:hypothetical protein
MSERISCRLAVLPSGRLVTALLLPLVALYALAPVAGRAQGDNTAAVALLPPAATFGDGWVLLQTDFPGQRDPAFRAATTGTYAGPAGARLVLDVMLVGAGIPAARDAWDRGNAYLQWYDANMLPESNVQRDQQLAAMAPPAGCSDALRVEGRERIGSTAFPIGVTLCAADPDVIYVAAVSGGLSGLSGVSASDAVIEMVLAASGATPVP